MLSEIPHVCSATSPRRNCEACDAPAKPLQTLPSHVSTSRRLAVSPSFQRKIKNDFESFWRSKRRFGRFWKARLIGESVGNAHLGTFVWSCIACLKHLGSRDAVHVMQASINVKMDDRSCFLRVTANDITFYITRVLQQKGHKIGTRWYVADETWSFPMLPNNGWISKIQTFSVLVPTCAFGHLRASLDLLRFA